MAGKRYCDFCGKHEDEVEALVAGVKVHICNECVALCDDIVKANRAKKNRREWCVQDMAKAYFEETLVNISVPRMGIKTATWNQLGPEKERYYKATEAALKAAERRGFNLTEETTV